MEAMLLRIGRRLREAVREPILRHRARQVAILMRCSATRSVDPQNMESGWSYRDTTPGERAVIEFLARDTVLRAPKILHVGIGNGDFGRSLSGIGADVVGISISGGEIANSRNAYRTTHLVDKYVLRELVSVLGDDRFNWIVDVNLFSYACCWGHAMRYLWFLDSHLAVGGSLITHATGARYAPTGFLLTPSLLERLAAVAGIRVTHGSNGVILLRRSS